jgi:hypothetical protein
LMASNLMALLIHSMMARATHEGLYARLLLRTHSSIT